MKKILLVLVTIALATVVGAQIKNPVDWKYSSKKKGAGYLVEITATIKKPWHIYSQNTGKSGPVPTSITFTKNPLVTFVEGVNEVGKLEKIYDNAFHTDVLFYSNTVTFTQEVKVKAGIKTNVTGTVEYMVCNDEQCLPPTKKTFSISLN